MTAVAQIKNTSNSGETIYIFEETDVFNVFLRQVSGTFVPDLTPGQVLYKVERQDYYDPAYSMGVITYEHSKDKKSRFRARLHAKSEDTGKELDIMFESGNLQEVKEYAVFVASHVIRTAAVGESRDISVTGEGDYANLVIAAHVEKEK